MVRQGIFEEAGQDQCQQERNQDGVEVRHSERDRGGFLDHVARGVPDQFTGHGVHHVLAGERCDDADGCQSKVGDDSGPDRRFLAALPRDEEDSDQQGNPDRDVESTNRDLIASDRPGVYEVPVGRLHARKLKSDRGKDQEGADRCDPSHLVAAHANPFLQRSAVLYKAAPAIAVPCCSLRCSPANPLNPKGSRLGLHLCNLTHRLFSRRFPSEQE